MAPIPGFWFPQLWYALPRRLVDSESRYTCLYSEMNRLEYIFKSRGSEIYMFQSGGALPRANYVVL